MRVSPCRRSRFYLYETFSPFRCPVRFLQPVRYRSHAAESVHQCLQLWCFRAVQHCTLLRQRRSRYATTDGLLHRWKLGFKQFSFHHADRTCGASPYISSGLSAFSLCYFPLCLSTPGRVSVLRGHLLSTFCSYEAIVCAPKWRTVGTGEPFGAYAFGGSPSAFHFRPGTHRSRSWPSTRRGIGAETTGGAVVWAAGLEQTVERAALGPSW